MKQIVDKIYGVLEIKDELVSPYDRSTGSVIPEVGKFTGLDVIKTEDNEHYALDFNKYYAAKKESHYTDVYQYGDKYFRYNITDGLVSVMSLATQEEILEDAEWIERHHKNLYNLVNVDGIIYSVWGSVGLAKENWDNQETRDEYLSEWISDIAEECSSLLDDFIKYELKEDN